MSIFGGTSTQTTYGALIDIGSGSVGVGIVESNASQETPKLLYTHREQMRISVGESDREELLRKIREALFSAGLALSTEGLQKLTAHNKKAKIKRILVTCSSPWAHTISRRVSYQNEKAFKVTKSLIADLESDAAEKAEEELQESAIVGELGLRTVERSTVDTKINGYSTNTPEGKKGNEVELSHIIGLIPEEILETVYEIQEKILTDTDLSAHTFMFVNYCVARDILTDMDSFGIVDVTGETTEIGIVEDDLLRETQHAAYGMHTLIRHVAKQSNSTAEHALTLLRGYAEGTLSKSDHDDVQTYLLPYTAALTEVLNTIHQTKSLPAALSITALPQLQHLFEKLTQQAFSDVRNAECEVLDTARDAVEKMGLPKDTDTFIALSSGFFHKLHGCGEIDTL